MDVSFNEEQQPQHRGTSARKTSFLTRLVLRSGVVKDERSAQWVLAAIALIAAIATISVILGNRPEAYEVPAPLIPLNPSL